MIGAIMILSKLDMSGRHDPPGVTFLAGMYRLLFLPQKQFKIVSGDISLCTDRLRPLVINEVYTVKCGK